MGNRRHFGLRTATVTTTGSLAVSISFSVQAKLRVLCPVGPVLIAMVICVLPCTLLAQITLTGNEHLNIDTEVTDRVLMFDTSSINILTGANLSERVNAFDQTEVTVFGGASHGIQAYSEAAISVLGGYVQDLSAYGTSTLSLDGGTAQKGAVYENAHGHRMPRRSLVRAVRPGDRRPVAARQGRIAEH